MPVRVVRVDHDTGVAVRDVAGILPNEGAIIRLIGAVLLDANDERQLRHRYMQTEVMAELTPSLIDVVPSQIHRARLTRGHLNLHRNFHQVDGRDP